MEKKLLIISNIIICFFCVGFIVIFTKYPGIHEAAMNIYKNRLSAFGENYSALSLLKDGVDLYGGELTDGHSIRLELPSGTPASKVKISNDYMNKTVSISIPGADAMYLNDFPILGKSNRISDITYSSIGQVGTLDIKLDGIYETLVEEEDRFLYIDFPKIKAVYDYVVVIDAGHGSKDGGAVKNSYIEKDINLEMLLKMKEIFDKEKPENVGVFYTRTDDTNPRLDDRIGLANEINADVFVSIHQNSTASGRQSNINGTEVMYRSSDETGESKAFAALCLENLLNDLGSLSKGIVAGDEIFIIRNAKMPVALAEIGFMTNSKEMSKLKDEEYQMKAMRAIYNSIMEYMGVE